MTWLVKLAVFCNQARVNRLDICRLEKRTAKNDIQSSLSSETERGAGRSKRCDGNISYHSKSSKTFRRIVLRKDRRWTLSSGSCQQQQMASGCATKGHCTTKFFYQLVTSATDAWCRLDEILFTPADRS